MQLKLVYYYNTRTCIYFDILQDMVIQRSELKQPFMFSDASDFLKRLRHIVNDNQHFILAATVER